MALYRIPGGSATFLLASLLSFCDRATVCKAVTPSLAGPVLGVLPTDPTYEIVRAETCNGT